MPAAPPVLLAWCTVVVVWSTTPLFLHFSTLAFSPALAGGLRMALAALLLLGVLAVTRRMLPSGGRAWTLWLAMLPGVFGSMYCSYLAAQRIPTGLISVIFGLSPVLSALLARRWLAEPALGPVRAFAAAVSLAGLLLIAGGEALSARSLDPAGVLLVCLAVLLFSASGVAVKKLGAGMDPFVQTTGALLLSLPLYALAWLAEGLPLPQTGSTDYPLALGAILYLAVAGSVLGFVCYYHVLQRMPAANAALTTVVTPVFALVLGSGLNDEHLTAGMLAGALLVLAGVAGFLFPPAWRLPVRRLPRGSGRPALTEADK
ncbi:MAG: DMT family transporter [Pseudomonadota bacterium]